MPTTVCLYSESKEKLDFRKLADFIRDKFAFKAKLLKLKRTVVQTKGLLFDPVNTQRLFEKIKIKRIGIDILVSDKLIATYEDTDKRLHLRAAVFGYPSVISTSGAVEAPAKPKEYYLAKQKYGLLKVWELKEEELKHKFRNKFIDYHDARLTEVLEGYIAQAIFFALKGKPFCENKGCRLFNAHWQEDLIMAQIKSGRFCKFHNQQLNKIKRGG